MEEAIKDISPDRLGRFTLVFDNFTNPSNGEELLAQLFRQVYPPTQYLYFGPPFLFAETASFGSLFSRITESQQNNMPNRTTGQFLFAFYEDLKRFSPQRLEELLSFYSLVHKNLNHHDREIEANLFCVVSEIVDVKAQTAAYEHIRHVVERLAAVRASSRETIKLYLVVCPIIFPPDSYLEATVRWAYLRSREIRPDIFDKLHANASFSNITYVGYHDKECEKNRRLIKEITGLLGDRSFGQTALKELVQKNFGDIAARCREAIVFDTEAFISGFPVPKDAVGSLFAFFFKRAGLYTALYRLEDAINDTYLYSVHMPMFQRCDKKIYVDDAGLLRALFEGAPLGCICEWGQEVVNELLDEIEIKGKTALTVPKGFFKPTLGWTKLRSKIAAYIRRLLETSQSKLPLILARRLSESLSEQIVYYKQQEQQYKDNLSITRRQLAAQGGVRFSCVADFVLQANRAAEDSVSVNYTESMNHHKFLILSPSVKRDWDKYRREAATIYGDIYYPGDAGGEVLQVFYLVEFNDAEKRMFRLEN